MAFSDSAEGHVTHHVKGAAGLYGLEIHEIPFDYAQMDIELEALMIEAKKVRPKLIIIAGIMFFFTYSLREVRKVADEVGAFILYDESNMGRLIAGGSFQQPLKEGADLMTGSTYKSFGGAPSGMILSNSVELAERLDKISFPVITTNFDLSRVAAMVISVLDLLTHGQEYARSCITNAKTLAEILHTGGCTVFFSFQEKVLRIPSMLLFQQQLMGEETLRKSSWKNKIYLPAGLVCHCHRFLVTSTRCVWELRKLRAGVCVRKIWK